MKSYTIFIISALLVVIIITYFRIQPIQHESFITSSSEFKEDDSLPTLNIINYFTEDGGITVHWQKPPSVVDYLAIIKDEEGDDEVKVYFKDTLSAECNDAICKYSFQNLVNGKKYSIVIASVSEGGISKFSKKIEFTPTFQKMQCNANGTCSVVKSDITTTLEAKIDGIMSNKDATKEVLSKCQDMLDSDQAVYDIRQIYEADGHFRNVKDRLQYPEHLLLPIKKGPESLAELVKHQLELGIVNINVHNQAIADSV